VAGIALIAGAIAWLVIRKRNKPGTVGAGTAYSAVAPGDTSYHGGAGGAVAAGAMPPSTYAPSSVSPHMSHAGYFPAPNSGGLRPETPYLAGGTPTSGAYDPRTASYYDPAKAAEQHQQQQYGGYVPYPGPQPAAKEGYAGQQYAPAHELDPTSMPSGHQSNPVEMAAYPPTER
jgi:hypothetical protein